MVVVGLLEFVSSGTVSEEEVVAMLISDSSLSFVLWLWEICIFFFCEAVLLWRWVWFARQSKKSFLFICFGPIVLHMKNNQSKAAASLMTVKGEASDSQDQWDFFFCFSVV